MWICSQTQSPVIFSHFIVDQIFKSTASRNWEWKIWWLILVSTPYCQLNPHLPPPQSLPSTPIRHSMTVCFRLDLQFATQPVEGPLFLAHLCVLTYLCLKWLHRKYELFLMAFSFNSALSNVDLLEKRVNWELLNLNDLALSFRWWGNFATYVFWCKFLLMLLVGCNLATIVFASDWSHHSTN